MFPTMISHRCSEGIEGGFFKRVEEGTWMGHVIEHIALEITNLGRYGIWFWKNHGVPVKKEFTMLFFPIWKKKLVSIRPKLLWK